MRPWKVLLTAVVLVPILVVFGYVAYLAATYIDETVTFGSAYGFDIGASKQHAFASVAQLEKHPNAVIYASYGPRAGDYFTVSPLPERFEQLQKHDRWDVLLDGDGQFFDSVELTFRDNRLVKIYRHRQHFELP